MSRSSVKKRKPSTVTLADLFEGTKRDVRRGVANVLRVRGGKLRTEQEDSERRSSFSASGRIRIRLPRGVK